LPLLKLTFHALLALFALGEEDLIAGALPVPGDSRLGSPREISIPARS
jgi:hypothetical protein